MLTPEKMIEELEMRAESYRVAAGTFKYLTLKNEVAKQAALVLDEIAREFRAQLEAEQEPQ